MVDVPLHVVPGQSPGLRLQHRGTSVAVAKEGVDIIPRALRTRGLKALGVSYRPTGQEPPIAPAHNTKALRVNEGALAQRYLQPCHHIREVAAAPITVHRPCKCLTVALAATWIGVDHGVSCSGVHLEFVKEVMPILRVGAAVDIQQRWVALPWLVAVWPHDP